jgi:hypothetical protein
MALAKLIDLPEKLPSDGFIGARPKPEANLNALKTAVVMQTLLFPPCHRHCALHSGKVYIPVFSQYRTGQFQLIRASCSFGNCLYFFRAGLHRR